MLIAESLDASTLVSREFVKIPREGNTQAAHHDDVKNLPMIFSTCFVEIYETIATSLAKRLIGILFFFLFFWQHSALRVCKVSLRRNDY